MLINMSDILEPVKILPGMWPVELLTGRQHMSDTGWQGWNSKGRKCFRD